MGLTNPYGREFPNTVPGQETGVVDSRTFNFNDPANMTHPTGGGGSVTYKPNWGQPIIDGQWRGAQAAQDPEIQRLATTDPREIVQQQQKQALSQLEADVAAKTQEATRDAQHKLRQLAQERDVKFRHLQNKHLGPGADKAKTPEERMKLFHDAVADLDEKMELAKLRIDGSVQPDLDEIGAQKQQIAAQIQRDFENGQLQLNLYDKLAEDGFLDPTIAKYLKLKTAGVDIPLSDVRVSTEAGRRNQLYRQLQQSRSISNEIAQQIEELGTEYSFDNLDETDAERKLRVKRQQELVVDRSRVEETIKQILSELNPKRDFGKVGQLNKAHASVLPATGEPVGTVGTAVKGELEKQSGSKTTGGRVSVISPDGVKGTVPAEELQQHLAQGFRRI